MTTIQLSPGEHIVLVLRKHWFIFFTSFFSLFLALAFGFALFSLRDTLYSALDAAFWEPFFHLLFLLYALFLLGVAFVIWIQQYFDLWVVTNHRIIMIEQRRFFDREISEFMISKVQDVTIDIPHMIATLLGYGNMTIETAGERSFTVENIPRLDEAKRLIITCVDEERKFSRAVSNPE